MGSSSTNSIFTRLSSPDVLLTFPVNSGIAKDGPCYRILFSGVYQKRPGFPQVFLDTPGGFREQFPGITGKRICFYDVKTIFSYPVKISKIMPLSQVSSGTEDRLVRPVIYDYENPVTFIRDMIAFRKNTEASFSVLKATGKLRKLSPALVSLIIKGKRRMAYDRAEEMAVLCGLKGREKHYFIEWIKKLESQSGESFEASRPSHSGRSRKQASENLLRDWLNVYVKDSVRLCKGLDKSSQKEELIRILGGIASESRIEKSLLFLLREGYLRITQDGKMVEDTPLTTAGDGLTRSYVRKFHKRALMIAKEAIDTYDTNERYANSLILPLNQDSYEELTGILRDFAEKLKIFCESHAEDSERLYQITVNLSPTGGKND